MEEAVAVVEEAEVAMSTTRASGVTQRTGSRGVRLRMVRTMSPRQCRPEYGFVCVPPLLSFQLRQAAEMVVGEMAADAPNKRFRSTGRD